MKKLLQLVFIIFLLSACGKSDPDKLIDELAPVLWEAKESKKASAENAYVHYFESKITHALPPEVFSDLANVHAIAKRFYDFSAAFGSRYDGQENFPQDQLMARFGQSFDSISAMVPNAKFTHFDYLQSAHKTNLPLTVIRMQYEMASLETDAMNSLAEKNEAGVIHDDFNNSPYTKTSKPSDGFQYGFSVHMKYLQQSVVREILVDSLLQDGKLTQVPSSIDQEDILGVVNFKSLAKGSYMVKGKVNGVVDGQAIALPFSHRFRVQ